MPISQVLRTAVSGMVSHKLNMDVIANNLANVNTTGFKTSRANFQDLLYQTSRQATANRGLRMGSGVRVAEIQGRFTQGALQNTGASTDMSIYGDGFFQVQLPDGSLAYSRNGSFRLDAEGRLVTGDGSALVPAIIVPPGEESFVTIDPEGVVQVALPGELQSRRLGQLTLATFNNPEGLEAIGQTLYRQTVNSGAARVGLPNTQGFGQIVEQSLEMSNINMAEEMTNMVVAQRAYGMSLKALQTLDEMVGMANNMRSR